MGDTGGVTSAAPSTSAPAAAAATPEQARTAWPWLALQGVVLIALALVAAFWVDGGPRLLLGGVGVVGAVRGIATLRAARSGAVDRQSALTAATAVWVGLVAVGLAVLPGAVAAWTFVAVTVGGALLVAARAQRRARAVLLAVLVLVALVVGGLTAGAGWTTGFATIAVAVAVLVLGVVTAVAAGTAWKVARQPDPAPAAGCGGCACGAGGCGGLTRG